MGKVYLAANQITLIAENVGLSVGHLQFVYQKDDGSFIEAEVQQPPFNIGFDVGGIASGEWDGNPPIFNGP